MENVIWGGNVTDQYRPWTIVDCLTGTVMNKAVLLSLNLFSAVIRSRTLSSVSGKKGFMLPWLQGGRYILRIIIALVFRPRSVGACGVPSNTQ